MAWEIERHIGAHSRPGVDASGWLWEIRRGEGESPADVRRVLVEISGTAGGVDRTYLPRDTAEAIASEGESEVAKVLGLHDPPHVIQCGTDGCRPARTTS